MKKEKKEKIPKTPEQKIETKRTVRTVILAVIAVAAIVGLFVYNNEIHKDKSLPDVKKAEVTSLESISLSVNNVKVPFVPSDIDNIVYTANSAGEITFYEFDGKQYNPVDESGILDISVPLSGQNIPVTLHYIERDSKISGYGVFIANQSDNINIYSFLLCKITNMPAGFEQESRCLLLVNTNSRQVYSTSPVWEEEFVLSRNNGTMTRFVSDGNRTVDINGAVRSDFSMTTDIQLKSKNSTVPFFSRREYDVSDTRLDVYLKTQSGESAAVRDVLDTYAYPTEDGGFIYLKKETGGFSVNKYLNGNTTTVKDYYSEYGQEYVRSGNWLLSKEDGRVYSIIDDTEYTLPEFKMNPAQFLVSADGKYIVMIGTVTNVLDYEVYIYNTQTGKYKSFADTDYTEHYGLFMPNAATACFYTVAADGYQTRIIDLTKI